jgi:hypothetical protein
MLWCASGEEEEQQGGEEEEEQQHGEEEQGGEEEWHGEEDWCGEEEEAELECLPRQIWRSYVVAPHIAPSREEDRVLIRRLGDR